MKAITVLTIYVLLSAVPTLAQEQDSTSKIICIVEHPAQFPGGVGEYKKFVKKNVKYPGHGRLCIEGSVYIGFTVHPDGSLTDFAVVKGICTECDENAMEALKKMPRWIPATTSDERKPIKIRMTVPVKFGL
ncbi:energy transducer TonB [Fulvivirgaceae bacterium PWU5]|uniref:Energy transducer TonB n=1 Tax=Dawidia cretensis TaxID=2782350 RepID=A0AAP2E0A5_9BACT|nr:TonB family protein [Dawidia cretensis]MBT1709548.1 energy transducer TonB [Dawidia cretensis]